MTWRALCPSLVNKYLVDFSNKYSTTGPMKYCQDCTGRMRWGQNRNGEKILEILRAYLHPGLENGGGHDGFHGRR